LQLCLKLLHSREERDTVAIPGTKAQEQHHHAEPCILWISQREEHGAEEEAWGRTQPGWLPGSTRTWGESTPSPR